MIKIALIQHEDSTPMGSTFEWLEKNRISFDLYHMAHAERLPHSEDYSGLIIAGGSMNVDELEKFPWLKKEKICIQHFIQAKKKIFGLCLGSQLLAETLGGEVKKNDLWEVGWHEVQISHDLQSDFSNPKKFMVFQMHQYGFTLPPGAKSLATNTFSANQAFSYRNQIIATQFHPESTSDWLKQCANSPQLPRAITVNEKRFVKSPEEIISGMNYLLDMKNWYFNYLDQLFLTDSQ